MPTTMRVSFKDIGNKTIAIYSLLPARTLRPSVRSSTAALRLCFFSPSNSSSSVKMANSSSDRSKQQLVGKREQKSQPRKQTRFKSNLNFFLKPSKHRPTLRDRKKRDMLIKRTTTKLRKTRSRTEKNHRQTTKITPPPPATKKKAKTNYPQKKKTRSYSTLLQLDHEVLNSPTNKQAKCFFFK